MSDIDVIARVITHRRTNRRVDPERPVARDAIEQLCSLATWAPNHKRTDP